MNILVDAFVDNNLGDDLMLEMLVQRFPDTLFFCLRDASLNARAPYKDWPNFLVPHWTDLDRILPFMDGLLVFGGSAWQDHGNNLDWFAWRDMALRKLKARGCPILAIGNNIGPVQTQEGQELFTNLLRRFDAVVVRDQASFNWLEAHAGSGRGTLGADLVLGYPVPKVTREPGLVGISVHRTMLFQERNEPYARHLCDLVGTLHREDPSLRFQFFAFDTISENDELLVDRILASLGWPPWASKVAYRGDIPAFLEAFGRCDRIFASRFHATILALLFEQPFVPFDYMGKTRDLLRDLDYEGIIVAHDHLEDDLAAIAKALRAPSRPFSAKKLESMCLRAGVGFQAIASALASIPHQATAKRAILGLLALTRQEGAS